MLGEVAVPTAPQWGGFAVVCLFLLFAGEKVFSIGRGIFAAARRNEPVKREVSFSTEYASATDFRELKDTVAENEKAAASELKEFRAEVKEDINGVHERVTGVSNQLSELCGRIDEALKRRG